MYESDTVYVIESEVGKLGAELADLKRAALETGGEILGLVAELKQAEAKLEEVRRVIDEIVNPGMVPEGQVCLNRLDKIRYALAGEEG